MQKVFAALTIVIWIAQKIGLYYIYFIVLNSYKYVIKFLNAIISINKLVIDLKSKYLSFETLFLYRIKNIKLITYEKKSILNKIYVLIEENTLEN